MADDRDPVFVTEPPDFLLCTICLHVLRDPYQTPCGHRFCKDCITRVVSSPFLSRCCPIDRRPIDNTNMYPDNAVKLQINALQVKCPVEPASCDWTGGLSDASAHVERCVYSRATCALCGTAMSRAALAVHSSSQCLKRPVKCPHCGQDYPSEQAGDHEGACSRRPEKCPNACRPEPFPRCELSTHLESHCPRQVVPCEMAVVGCRERLERGAMADHVRTCSVERAATLARRVVQQEQDVQRLRDELAAQAQEMKLLRRTACPTSGQFTWCVPNIRQRIKSAREGDHASAVLYSPEFFSHEGGYLLQLCICPAGDNSCDYMSLYFVIMQGPFDDVIPWPFQLRVTLTLLSCNTSGYHVVKEIVPDPRLHYFHRPKDVRNVGYGYPKLIPISKLEAENSEYVGSGCIYLRAKVL